MLRIVRSLRRRRALAELDRLDAEVARYLVYDGSLSLRPLDAPPLLADAFGVRASLRRRRCAIIERLERCGGRDPWPSVLREPTHEQRVAWRSASRLKGGVEI